jgi:hypothetical protein
MEDRSCDASLAIYSLETSDSEQVERSHGPAVLEFRNDASPKLVLPRPKILR